MATSSELNLWTTLDKELLKMVDTFRSCIAASAMPDEESEQQSLFSKERKAPGDMIEVWAEKLIYSGHTSLYLLSQLKKGALLGDFENLVSNVRTVRTAFGRDEESVNERLSEMKLEVQGLLGALEQSYYSSQHRGRVVTAGTSQELKELCQLALECGHKHA